MSTGVADYNEIGEACDAASKFGADGYALLHCISDYPSHAKDMKLKTIQELKSHFNVPIGLSDHSIGSSVAVAAITLGATIIEKHFTLDHNMDGPDHKLSANPDQLKLISSNMEEAFVSIGQKEKKRQGYPETRPPRKWHTRHIL